MKKMNYPFMCPPLEFQSFREMSKKEAQEHFDWYINEIPGRLELLKNAFEFTGGGDKKILDFSPESLKPLWSWFILQVKMIPKSKKEIEDELRKYPKWMKDQLGTHRVSTETLAVGMDIAKYFAEVFIKNFSGVKWGLVTKPKSYVYVNRPVLMGFKHNQMDPGNNVHVLTLKVADGEKNSDTLYDMYNYWKDYVQM